MAVGGVLIPPPLFYGKMNFKLRLPELFFYLIKLLMWLIIALELIKIGSYIAVTLHQFQSSQDYTFRLVVRILNLLIIYEIFLTLTSAFEFHRIKLTYVVDTAIIFFIRELIVVVFSSKEISPTTALTFGGLIFSLGLLRIISVRFSPAKSSKG